MPGKNIPMLESLKLAKNELIRADHLIFVSLKYTRTVDVIKNTVKRLIAAFDYGMGSLLEKLKGEGKIDVVPSLPRIRLEEVKKHFGSDALLMTYLEFYLLLKKIDKAKYDRALEYRRHVTMTAHIGDKPIEVTIDIIGDYFEKTKEFISYVENIVVEPPKEE